MFLIILIIFVIVPVIELNVLIQVGQNLGSLTTVGLVLLTAVVGVSLVRSQGISTMMQVQQKLARGEAPGQQIVEGMMLAAAGLLLLFPGFVTDLLGLILLTPFTRIPVAAIVYKKMQANAAKHGATGFSAGFGSNRFGAGGFGHHFDPRDGQGAAPRSHQDEHEGNTFDGEFERKHEPEQQIHTSKKTDDEQGKK